MESRTPRSDVLAGWLATRRWYATKTRRIEALAVEDTVALGGGVLVIAGVTLDDGAVDRYAIPLLPPRPDAPVVDALDDPGFCRALVALVARGGRAAGVAGEVRGRPTAVLHDVRLDEADVRPVGGEQSNTSVRFGERLILKHFRRLAEGVNPEAEMTRFLTERARFAGTPRLCGQLDYHRGGSTMTLAVVHEFVAGARDGWEWTLGELLGRAHGQDTARVDELGGPSLGALERLGQVTGGLHRALASDPDDPAFAPEPITAADVAGWTDEIRHRLDVARAVLGRARLADDLPLAAGLEGLRGCVKIRHHGDLHLGQTLYRPATGDFVVIDFEGEPLRPLAARRLKQAALRDVAGVLRSIDYAAAAAATAAGAEREPWARAWEAAAARAFVTGYRARTRGAPFVPGSDAAFGAGVAVFELEKAAYEIVYEANHRPDWVGIATRGLLRAASRLSPSATAGAA
jgi:trehalose synthase-fused probable maltokinase